LPWFITASQAVVSRFGHGDLQHHDSESLKSGESQQQFRSGSKDSSKELETVVVLPPTDEKILKR
jgi:AGZA family xanthine/uracil permease-like MFS transporter